MLRYTLSIASLLLIGFFNCTSTINSPVAKTLPVTKNEQLKTNGFEPVAVAELFTSHGCSSCPPAEQLLARTIIAGKNNPQFYALSFHVDYWNRLGWTDPFSSAACTQRQYEYVERLGLNGAYTPQMVVNGKTEFVGSDAKKMEQSLKAALATPARNTFVVLTATRLQNNNTEVTFKLDHTVQKGTINFALAQRQQTTQVQRGENAGRSLTGNNIVRDFKSIAATVGGTITLQLPPDAGANLFDLVAYQQLTDGAIIAAAKTAVQ